MFDVATFMVSLDKPEKNAEFAASLGAALPVVSDPDGEVAKAYGVLAFGRFYARRWTFYIDAGGILRRIDKDVQTQTAGSDIARQLGELGFPRRTPMTATP